jgi:hypothetical protein
MKINQIIESSTTAGSVATVPFAMNGMQTRNPSIYGQKKVGNLFKGKKTNKPYANSLTEGRVKELAMDLKDLTDDEFQKKYNLTKKEARKILTAKPEKINRDDLQEEDLILVPGHGRNSRGFISKASDRSDREVEMAKGDLYQSIKNAKMIFDMLGDVSEEDGIEGWVQEKIIKASDYLNTVREYMEQQRFANEMTGGVIGNGMAGESVEEAYDPNDESDVWYQFDPDSKKILRKFIRHTQTHLAKSQGWSESPDQAMRVYGYFPSKFKPNQFVKKGPDGKWISVTPVSEAKKKVNPYAVGMAQAMKSTGDKPPLKKSTIVKGHEIAKKIKQKELDEGWKSKLAGAALAGAAALGGGGAHAGGMSLPPAGLTPAQAQEFTNAQFAGQQAINQHAAQQRAGKIDYTKDGPITKSSLGHKLEYGIPVNAKGDFINPNRLPNIHELPRDEIDAMAEAYQAWLKDYLNRWPNAKQQADGSMQAIKPGLAPMYPK